MLETAPTRWPTWARRAAAMFAGAAAAATVTAAAIPPAAASAQACRLTYDPALLAIAANGTAYFDEEVGTSSPTDECSNYPGDVIVKRSPDGSTSVIAKGALVPGIPIYVADQSVYSGAVDSTGNLLVSVDDAVVRITPQGSQSVVAGEFGKQGRPTPGKATHSELDGTPDLAVDSHGNLYIADTFNDVVEKVTPQGQLSILAGDVRKNGPPIPGPASRSTLFRPDALAVDRAGDLYIGTGAGRGMEYVAEVSPQGTLSVVAGDGSWGAPKQGVKAVDSPLGVIWGVAVAPSGRLFVATGSDLFTPVFNDLWR